MQSQRCWHSSNQTKKIEALIEKSVDLFRFNGSILVSKNDPQLDFANASAANGAVEGFVRAAAIELKNGIRINAVSPAVIENSPQYLPFFPGDISVTMQQLEYGFRKSVFGANTEQVIKP